jgi:hypothetical protein
VQEAPVLRPLSVGDIIDRMLRLLRADPVLFIGIAAIPTLVSDVLQRAVGLTQTFDVSQFTAALNTPGATPTFPQQLQPINPGLAAVVAVVSVVLSVIQAAALTYAIGQRYLGRPETIGDAYSKGTRALPRLFLSFLLVGVLAAVVFGLVALVIVLSAAALAIVAVILGLIAFFFVLPWAFLSLAFVTPAIVLEGLGPVAAIRRSFQLVDKARLRTLGLWILMGLIASLLGVIFSVIFLASFVANPTVSAVLQTAATVASGAISGPLLYGALTILYYDMRVRKEAFDLQLAAEALPREG